MNVGDRHYRTIWLNEDGWSVDIIDQRRLPHEFRVETVRDTTEIATAIRDMWVRGAPLIGVAAAYGMALQMRADPSDASLDEAWEKLHETRPTAINLRWALDAMRAHLKPLPESERDGYSLWRARGFTYVSVNLPPERTRREDLFVITCEYEPGDVRTSGTLG